jgi:biopolymer transport protein ExbD
MARKLTGPQRSYIRKKSTPHELDPSEAAGELNIVPFLDIVMNIIMFLLATTQTVLLLAEIEAQLPQLGRGRGAQTEGSALNLSVTVTQEGIVVAGSGGKLAPGCEGTMTGRVITVPKTSAGYDWAALTRCVARVKAQPQFADETQVIVGADPTIEYEHMIRAMDALRSQGTTELFPNVMLSAGVR